MTPDEWPDDVKRADGNGPRFAFFKQDGDRWNVAIVEQVCPVRKLGELVDFNTFENELQAKAWASVVMGGLGDEVYHEPLRTH